MSKKQPQYPQEINDRAELYRLGLEQVQHFLLQGQFSQAVEQGLKTILQCCQASVPETDDLKTLFIDCILVMEDLPTFISLALPIPEFAKRLTGILMERHAFYRQLENSSN